MRCFVAKTHLSRFTRFFRQQMSTFYLFRWGGGSPKADIVCFFYRFSYMMATQSSYLVVEHKLSGHVVFEEVLQVILRKKSVTGLWKACLCLKGE